MLLLLLLYICYVYICTNIELNFDESEIFWEQIYKIFNIDFSNKYFIDIDKIYEPLMPSNNPFFLSREETILSFNEYLIKRIKQFSKVLFMIYF